MEGVCAMHRETELLERVDERPVPNDEGSLADVDPLLESGAPLGFDAPFVLDLPAELASDLADPSLEDQIVSNPAEGERGLTDASEPVGPAIDLRPLKVVEAVPLRLTPGWMTIDAPGRGRSKLPMARLEAIAVSAVEGLGPRPVLVVDLLLDGRSTSAPIKLLRVRSDRFDPLSLVPEAANPLDALLTWIRRLEHQSQAACLPGRELLEGRFERYATVSDHERKVLNGRSAR
jgi:hypothetical protein